METNKDGSLGEEQVAENIMQSGDGSRTPLPRDERQTFWTSCQHCKTRHLYCKTKMNATLTCRKCTKSFKARELRRTFWTSCHHCETRYQYWKTMMNATIRCQQCTKSFTAHDIGCQGASSPGFTRSPFDNHKEPSKHVPTEEAWKSNGEKPCGGGLMDKFVQSTTSVGSVDPSGLNAGVYRRKSSRNKQHVSYTETAEGDSQSSSERSQQHESFNLTEVGRKEVPATGRLFSNSSPASFTAGVAGQNGESSNLEHRKPKADNCSQLNSNLPPNFEISCPDPDFSDFEKDRADDCFAANQFWAIFDSIDSMPRFYALVRKVYSPFALRITWLDVDSDDQGEIDWHKAGLPVGCGKYKLCKSQITTDRAMFSHQIHCMKGSDKGSYLVYPKKGETWAIFRDWDIGWSSNPEKHSGYQFEYVEVLSDFDKNIGIRVSYLGKVKGFVSLFQQTVQNEFTSFCIPPNELYRFSHQIPSYKMTGNEREGVPRGSFELDPAGLPISLFEVCAPRDAEVEDGVLNNGVSASNHKSSMPGVEHAMSNEGIHKAKLSESNAAGRVSPILRRSTRSNVKSMNNGQASRSQYMSKCTARVSVSHKIEKSKGGHVTAGLTKASVGTSNPCTSTDKESQTPKSVESKRARQSESDLRDDLMAENVNGMRDTNVRENGIDTSGLDAGVHHRKSSRKRRHVLYTETDEGGDSQSSSEWLPQHESFNITEVGGKELTASGGLFNNNSAASVTAGVAGQKGEKRNKVSAQPVVPCNFRLCRPYPDFNDFEKVRVEDCFIAGQFWAIFDDIEAMPRFYALVREVDSPFKLQITWLHVDKDDQGEIDWHHAGLPVACGKHKLGQSQITTDRLMFSHQINCVKGSDNGSYLVYPKKGETWAIFRDWDVGCSSNPGKHSEQQYECVEVLSGFDENIGIGVSYLAKVKGFVSLFQQTVQNGLRSFCIPPNELYRFSHQIPSNKMTGNEREGVPRGSFELDPAGLPISLFEVCAPGDANLEDGVLNNGVNASRYQSSMLQVD